MKEFFRGWRRKVGTVTLVLACGLMAFWVRSVVKFDSVFFYCGTIRCGISSVDSRIWFLTSTPLVGESAVTWHTQEHAGQFDPMGSANVVWRRDWIGFHFGQYTRRLPGQTKAGEFEATSCTLPHWSLILPVTLLSAYLLLSPSRKRRPTTNQPQAVGQSVLAP